MAARTVVAALALFGAGALTGVALTAGAQAPPRMTARVLLDATTEDLRFSRTRVRLHLDTWEPASETGRHRHPGPTLIYVVEGELEEVGDAGTRRLRTGDAVWNRAGVTHNVRNRGARTARALAVHLDPMK